MIPGPNNWWGLTPTTYKVIFHDLLQEYNSYNTGYQGFQMAQQLVFGIGTTAGSGAWYPTPEFAGLHLGSMGSFGGLGGVGHGGIVGGMSQAEKVGSLSIRQSWASPVLEVSPAVSGTESASIHAGPNAGTGNALLRGVPTEAASRRGSTSYANKYGARISVLTRPPSAG